MKPETRLALCVAIIVGSSAYAVLVSFDTHLASAVALGYVAVVLTVLTVIQIGKRTHDRHP
jgi:hypothetical protein